jgi:hypothetical protein
MRATRRRKRTADPLASPDAVRDLMVALRSALPDLIPRRNKDLVRMLHAVRHVQRYPATDTKRGRPGRWGREDLLKVAARLEDLLDRETSSRLSLASFVDHYLRLLDFPTDIIEALTTGDINLFEASQLARLTPERLSITPSEAKRARTELLSSHLQTKASGSRLRLRINELLRGPAGEAVTPENNDLELDLEDFDPYDPTHLFWDQIKQLGFAFREIRREDVTDEEVEELLKVSEPVMSVVARIQRRKERGTASKVKV